MIICSHEVAHWLNKYTEHEDQAPIDSLAIESWADYFGMRLALTTLTHGRRLNEILNKFRTPALDAARSATLLSSCGFALKKVYENIYLRGSDAPGYPAPPERVYTIAAGTISFFKRAIGKFDLGSTLFTIRNIILTPFSNSEALSTDFDFSKTQQTSEKIIDIHPSLKGLNEMITPRVKPEFLNLISTNYLGHEENAEHREKLQSVVRGWGLDI